jgi:hypothetical protein
VQPSGVLDPKGLTTHREFLGIYFELGYAEGRFPLDSGPTVFANIARVVAAGSQPWWEVKYAVLETLFNRGAENDLRMVRAGIESLERSNPEFDGGTFGMKDKFLELKKKVEEALKR